MADNSYNTYGQAVDYGRGQMGRENLIPLQTSDKGGGQAHNNMPPYKAVYVFVRIA